MLGFCGQAHVGCVSRLGHVVLRRALLGGIAILTSAIAAAAADMPVKARPLIHNCWVGEFQGPHAGAFAAMSSYRPDRINTDGSFFALLTPGLTQSTTGGGGGVNLGYDIQCGNRVFGIEADWTFGRINSTSMVGLFPF